MTRLPSDLDPEVEREFLDRAETEIRQHGRLVITSIAAIGKKLAEVKKRLGHGKYEAFVRDRLRFSLDSALRFVQCYELVKSRNLRDLEFLQIDPSALYLLARPSTPEELRREVFERAKTEPVSRNDVAQRIRDAANVKTAVTTHKITLLAPTYTPEKAGATAEIPQLDKRVGGDGKARLTPAERIANTANPAADLTGEPPPPMTLGEMSFDAALETIAQTALPSPSPREQFEAERDAKVAGVVLEIQKLATSERLFFWGRCAQRWHKEIVDSLMNDLQVGADRLDI